MAHALAPDGVRIHYEIHSAGQDRSLAPVVLVQGLGLSSRFWFELPRDLANDPHRPRTTIVLDNCGTGRSDRPKGILRPSRMADDVVTVLDACGVEQAVVVGISMGGMIAMHAAVRHPGRVKGMVLMATSPGLPHGRMPTLHATAALLYTPFVRRRRVRWVNRILLPEHELDRAAELLAAWPAVFRKDPISPRTFLAQLAGVATHSIGFRLGRVRCPTVVVAGEDDILVPPENARRIARRIPRSRLVLRPGVAHVIPVQEPRIVQESLAMLEEMGGA